MFAATLALLMSQAPAPNKAGPDFLKESFQNPAPIYRPDTWWHWMNGNVTKDGITADL